MKQRSLYTLALLFTSLQAYAQIYTYDANNKLTKVEYGNGVTVSYEYDVLGNRTSRKVTGSIAETYTIKVSAVPSNYGTVSGGGTFGIGTNVEINASPYAGFEFQEWNDGSTDNPRTLTVTKDQSFTAHFKMSETNNNYDANGDGVINSYDLDAIIDAYLEGAPATGATDLDGDGAVTIADASILIAQLNDTHTGTYNGHDYVDLGLPSGTLWATCNVGASYPEENGCLYAWGEVTGSCEGKDRFSWSTYKYNNGMLCDQLTKYNFDPDIGYNGFTDNLGTLDPTDDAATVNWGGNWRMPTRREVSELYNKKYTEWTFTTMNGVKGFIVTSIVKGYTGNSIFLPAEGGLYDGKTIELEGELSYYWTSTLTSNYQYCASCFDLRANDGKHGTDSRDRCYGMSIRPVLSADGIPAEPIDDISKGLVAYYPFNGNANDESGHGNHGTIIGNVELVADKDGNPNSAYRFSGEPLNYISIPDNDILHLNTFTLSAWVYSDAEDYGNDYLINKGRDIENGSYRLYVRGVGATVEYGGTNDAFIDNIPSTKVWHFIAGTVEGNIAKFYLDGNLMDERTLSSPFEYNNSEPLTLGMHYYSGVPSFWAYPLYGILDEVRIYNRALSDDEIKQLAKDADLYCPIAEAIDLGLPSGTLWASWNVGASAPEEYGGYYAWGETEEKDYYDWSNYKYFDDDGNVQIGDDIAGTEYDVAHVKWGGSWIMPTTDQIKELIVNCTRKWTTQNGVSGALVTGPNGNAIFLPAAGELRNDGLRYEGKAGFYWSSSLYTESYVHQLYFDSGSGWSWSSLICYFGLPVRPVISPEKPQDTCPVAEAIDLGLPSGTLWASWNVGASTPEESGGYYAWGETEEKDYYDWSTYSHCDGTAETCHDIGDIAGTQYDVAHMKWGGLWRMPTLDQIQELTDNCTIKWTTQNGVSGRLVTGPNGRTIFLPAADSRSLENLPDEGSYGFYWMSQPSSWFGDQACAFYFDYYYLEWNYSFQYRFLGFPVRAVITPETTQECPVAEAIDLGLPSGTKWASWNVGASAPEESGGYYAWGETEEKDYYDWNTYTHCDGSKETIHFIGDDIAGTEYDVAHVKWGGSWRMPSLDQINELIDNCTQTWTTQNGVNGILITGPNGGTIFLPAAGDYWYDYLGRVGSLGLYWLSSVGPSYGKGSAYKLHFYSDDWNWTYDNRCGGFPVRPVCP